MRVRPESRRGAAERSNISNSVETSSPRGEGVFCLWFEKLRYPTGVRPLLIEAAARRKRIERRFVDALEGARFAEVVLPILDYVDAYATVAGRDNAKQAYRFVDRDGELVALRSDFTPMVARSLAPTIAREQLPLRVFYRGDVIRCDRTRLGSNREMFQIGAELIGDDSVEADVEMLKRQRDRKPDSQSGWSASSRQ